MSYFLAGSSNLTHCLLPLDSAGLALFLMCIIYAEITQMSIKKQAPAVLQYLSVI